MNSYFKVKFKIIRIVLISLILAITFFSTAGFFYLVKKNIQTIRPYYEKQVFQKPLDLEPKTASISAISTDEAMIKLPIIMFHYVEYVKDIGDFIRQRLNINPYTFERQLKALKDNNYQTYFVKEIPQMFKNKITPSENSIILTFDDGYEDFYTDVFPLLQKYNMKATVYIICDFIGRHGFLKEQQIKELAASGLVEIGDHTLDHLSLKALSTAVAEEQINGCKKRLEDDFGIEVKTIAYPYGAFSAETLEIVKEASFSAAVSVIPGAQHSSKDLFYLYRIRAGMVANDSIINILKQLK